MLRDVNRARRQLGLKPIVAAGGDSSAAKSARAKKQLRDKYGKWIEMGGSIKWTAPSGTIYSGTVSDFKGKYVQVSDVKFTKPSGETGTVPSATVSHENVEMQINAKADLGDAKSPETPDVAPVETEQSDVYKAFKALGVDDDTISKLEAAKTREEADAVWDDSDSGQQVEDKVLSAQMADNPQPSEKKFVLNYNNAWKQLDDKLNATEAPTAQTSLVSAGPDENAPAGAQWSIDTDPADWVFTKDLKVGDKIMPVSTELGGYGSTYINPAPRTHLQSGEPWTVSKVEYFGGKPFVTLQRPDGGGVLINSFDAHKMLRATDHVTAQIPATGVLEAAEPVATLPAASEVLSDDELAQLSNAASDALTALDDAGITSEDFDYGDLYSGLQDIVSDDVDIDKLAGHSAQLNEVLDELEWDPASQTNLKTAADIFNDMASGQVPLSVQDVAEPELTKEELTAVRQYAKEWSFNINGPLRRGEEHNTALAKTYSDNLDAAMEKSVLDADTELFRGVKGDFVDNLQVGGSIQDLGFMSTTSDDKAGTFFATNLGGEKQALIKFTAPAGSHAIDVQKLSAGHWGLEKEFILPRGTKLQLTSVENGTNPEHPDLKIFTAEIVPADAPEMETLDEQASGTADLDGGPGDSDATPGHSYTEAQLAAIEAYGLDDYPEINGGLREGKSVEQWQETIDQLDGLIAADTIETETTLYRGIQGGLIFGLTEGVELEDLGFVSTTKNIITARAFAGEPGPYSAVMEITIPAGTHALDFDKVDQAVDPDVDLDDMENEVLLARGTKLHIYGNEPGPDGRRIIYAEVVPAGSAQSSPGLADGDEVAFLEQLQNLPVGHSIHVPSAEFPTGFTKYGENHWADSDAELGEEGVFTDSQIFDKIQGGDWIFGEAPELLQPDVRTLDEPTADEQVALSNYVQSSYIAINNHLRGEGTEDEDLATVNQELNNEFDGIVYSADQRDAEIDLLKSLVQKSTLADDATLYRGVKMTPDELNIEPGSVVTDPAFMSTSANLKMAEYATTFLGVPGGVSGTGTIFRLNAPAGLNAVKVDEAGIEEGGIQSEFLLAPNTSLQVKDILPPTDGKNYYTVVADIVPTPAASESDAETDEIRQSAEELLDKNPHLAKIYGVVPSGQKVNTNWDPADVDGFNMKGWAPVDSAQSTTSINGESVIQEYTPGDMVKVFYPEPLGKKWKGGGAPSARARLLGLLESQNGNKIAIIRMHADGEQKGWTAGTVHTVQMHKVTKLGTVNGNDVGGVLYHKDLERLVPVDAADPDPDDIPALDPPTADALDNSPVIDVTGWQKVGGQQGSNPGGTYIDAGGNKYYVKQSKSDDHARNEVLARRLYDLTGTSIAELDLADVGNGSLGTVAPLIPGAKQDLAQHLNDVEYLAKIQEGFAVDAWLANWDVAGLVMDNVVTDGNGNPVRIDPGGALIYRAQGAPKGGAFADTAGEWDTLRDGSNLQSASLFVTMTDQQLANSAKKVTSITDEQLDAAIDSVGFDEQTASMLKDKLKKRRDDIAKRAAALNVPSQDVPGLAPAADPVDDGAYTQDEVTAVKKWVTTSYIPLNHALRNEGTLGEHDQNLIKELDSAIAKSVTATDMTLFRGAKETSAWLPSDMEWGTEITDLGYIATSLDEEIADGFGDVGFIDPVFFVIDLPAGSNAMFIPSVLGSDPAGEEEWLLPRGTTFKVTDDSIDEHGNRLIHVIADTSVQSTSVSDTVDPEEVDDAEEQEGQGGGAPDLDEGSSEDNASEEQEASTQEEVVFQVLEDSGESGDGYFPGTHLWGKYGAAGVMLRHVDEDGTARYLLVQRGPGVSTNQGKWQLPGGALNSKENDYQGTARELHEELSPPAGYMDGLTPTGEVLFTHESGWHYNNITTNVPEQFDPVVDGTETGDAKWFTEQEIDNLDLHPSLTQNMAEILGTFDSPALEQETADKVPDIGTIVDPVDPQPAAEIEPLEEWEKELLKGSQPKVSYGEVGHMSGVGDYVTLSDGNNVFLGDHVGHPGKGYTGTIVKIESNGKYVQVQVNETGKKQGLTTTKLVLNFASTIQDPSVSADADATEAPKLTPVEDQLAKIPYGQVGFTPDGNKYVTLGDGSNAVVGTKVHHPGKGYTGEIQLVEANGKYVQVFVEQTQKWHGFSTKKLEMISAPEAVEPEPEPEAPSEPQALGVEYTFPTTGKQITLQPGDKVIQAVDPNTGTKRIFVVSPDMTALSQTGKAYKSQHAGGGAFAKWLLGDDGQNQKYGEAVRTDITPASLKASDSVDLPSAVIIQAMQAQNLPFETKQMLLDQIADVSSVINSNAIDPAGKIAWLEDLYKGVQTQKDHLDPDKDSDVEIWDKLDSVHMAIEAQIKKLDPNWNSSSADEPNETPAVADSSVPIDSYDELVKLPVGSLILHTGFQTAQYTKTGPDEWTTPGMTTKFHDHDFDLAIDAGVLTAVPAASGPEPAKIISIGELDSLPAGSKVIFQASSNPVAYTKKSSGKWARDSDGYEIDADSFQTSIEMNVLTLHSKGAGGTPVGSKVTDINFLHALPDGATIHFETLKGTPYTKVDGKWYLNGDTGVTPFETDQFSGSVALGFIIFDGPESASMVTPTAPADEVPVGSVVPSIDFMEALSDGAAVHFGGGVGTPYIKINGLWYFNGDLSNPALTTKHFQGSVDAEALVFGGVDSAAPSTGVPVGDKISDVNFIQNLPNGAKIILTGTSVPITYKKIDGKWYLDGEPADIGFDASQFETEVEAGFVLFGGPESASSTPTPAPPPAPASTLPLPPGGPSRPDWAGNPMYIGTKVKSLTDGVEGVIAGMDANPKYIRVKITNPDGSTKTVGRRTTKLEALDKYAPVQGDGLTDDFSMKPGDLIDDIDKLTSLPIGSKISVTDDNVFTYEKTAHDTWTSSLGTNFTNTAFAKAATTHSLRYHSAANAVQPLQTPTSSIGKTDPSSPWFGKPKPTPPPLLDTDSGPYILSDTADALRGEAATKYSEVFPGKQLANSSITKQRVEDVINNGDKDALTKLLAKKIISQVTHNKIRDQIIAVNTERNAAAAQALSLQVQYEQFLREWKKAHGISLGDFDAASFIERGMKDGVIEHKSNGDAAKWWNKNSPDSSHFSSGAKSGLASYIGGSSINVSLRSDKIKSTMPGYTPGSNVNQFKGMEKAMKEVTPVKGDVIVHRGASLKDWMLPDGTNAENTAQFLAKVKPGAIVRDFGYGSTSIGTDAAFGSKPVQMKIRVPKGYKGIYVWNNGLGGYSGEREFILNRDTHYLVHNVYQSGHRIIVEVEIVPPGWTREQGLANEEAAAAAAQAAAS